MNGDVDNGLGGPDTPAGQGGRTIVPRTWVPWLGALALFGLGLVTVPEVVDVDAGFLVVLAALGAAPFGLITTRPATGWLLSATGALVVSRSFDIVDADPWPWPIVHGLVLLALLFATALNPPSRLPQALRIAVVVASWLSTAALLAASVPPELMAGWTVGVTAVTLAGTLVRVAGLIRPPPGTGPPVTAAEMRTRLMHGFRTAFIDWTASPPLGTTPWTSRLPVRATWTGLSRAGGTWLPALLVFWIAMDAGGSFPLLDEVSIRRTLVVHDLALPVLAALIALPVGLSGRYALLGWRAASVLAIVLALVGTPSDTSAPVTWPVVFQWAWILVTFVVSLRHDRWTTGWVWLASVAVMSTGAADNPGTAITLVVAVTTLVLVGSLIRSRRLAGRELERQTERSELEKARRTVLEERTRIARDLHDVVAHHMSMVVVQAETAPYRIPDLSEPAQSEFAAISTSARHALNEIRSLLGVLRSDDHAVTHAPQPGLDQLEELVGDASRSGVHAELTTHGYAVPVGLAVSQSAYRIVQESLANAARHAPGAEVEVTVGYTPDRLHLHVVNGPAVVPVARGEPGHGVIGMRERAHVVGGSLTAEALPDGGFAVRADLPLDIEEHDR